QAEQRAHDHQLAAVAIPDRAPQRSAEAGRERRRAEQDPRPHGARVRILHPELLEQGREERQEGREPDPRHEIRAEDDPERAPPAAVSGGVGERRRAHGEPSRMGSESSWLKHAGGIETNAPWRRGGRGGARRKKSERMGPPGLWLSERRRSGGTFFFLREPPRPPRLRGAFDYARVRSLTSASNSAWYATKTSTSTGSKARPRCSC